MDKDENTLSTAKELKVEVKDQNIEVILPSKNEDPFKLIKGLVAEKSIRINTSKKELLLSKENLNERDLPSILVRDDQNFYMEKKALYLESYPDLAEDPFDLDDLHSMIMEQIFQRNLMRKKKKHPFADIEKEYENSKKREGEFKKSLSVRRTDRFKQKGEKKQQVNIANLSVHFQDAEKMKAFEDRAKELKRENEEFGDSEKVFE